MTREDFLRRRAIAHHERTVGVVKVKAGDAIGAGLREKPNAQRACSRNRQPLTIRQDCDPFAVRARKLTP